MTLLDRLLQKWRIRKAIRYVPANSRVLDIGCADGVFIRACNSAREAVGIDPDLGEVSETANTIFVRGHFPRDLCGASPFDAIALLAVLEHVPTQHQSMLAQDCYDYLVPGGVLIITVPSPLVDHILSVLKALRLVHGMALEQHYGFEVKRTPALFTAVGLELLKASKFQLGLNNLFVFRRPE
jgi:2-polyprenyl-3-methyl-5-hydroxy-6-metoxy-1,4-benzoquinol methylase